MKQIERFRVSAHDTDFNEVARPSSVLRYMQEEANMQLHTFGPSNEELRERFNCTYILSRVGVAIYLPLRAYDEIDAESWACESHLTSFNRCGRIMLGDRVAVEMTSVWALCDLTDRHLLKVSDTYTNYGTDEPISPPSLPARLRIPRELELLPVGERVIRRSDVDYNRHMNNTFYPDMLMDYAEIGESFISSFSINFAGEAALGERITVLSARDGDRLYFRTVKENGKTGAEAEFTVTDSL